MIVISDTTMWAADVPSMCTGMRGLVDAEIDVHGPDRDLHSGSFGGGVPNPLHALAALLAGLHDADGRVTLPGFYDDVLPLSDAERELFARLPFDEKAWLAEAGHSQAAAGEAGYSTLERIWARPTAEINGMWGGHTGPGAKTIVPREAHAKVSFRLVANQEPADVAAALREYVAAHTPPGIEATVTFGGPGVRPASPPSTHRPCRRRGGRWSGRSGEKCCLPGKGAAGRRRTWPTSWRRRWCSSRSGWMRTGSTRPTRRWRWPCCSRARRRSPTCGTSWPGAASVSAADQTAGTGSGLRR